MHLTGFIKQLTGFLCPGLIFPYGVAKGCDALFQHGQGTPDFLIPACPALLSGHGQLLHVCLWGDRRRGHGVSAPGLRHGHGLCPAFSSGRCDAKPASGGSEGVRRNLYQTAAGMMGTQPAQTGRLYPIYWRFRKDFAGCRCRRFAKLPGSSCSFFMDNFPVVFRKRCCISFCLRRTAAGSCQRPDALLRRVSGRPEDGGTEGGSAGGGGLISLLMTGSTNRMETTSPA